MTAGPGQITGTTRACFIIGTPVKQVKTPIVFNTWARDNHADMVMLALDVSESGFHNFMQAMRDWSNCIGCVVTYPHKQAARSLVDEVTPEASFVGAVNVVRRTPDDRLIGGMTDGIGQFDALAAKNVSVGGASVLLIGAGGAGSAIAYEAARRGATTLVVIDIDRARQSALIERLRNQFADLVCHDHVPVGCRFDIACNASPVGMNGDRRMPFPIEDLDPSTVISDAVPSPAITPWLEAARRRGMTIQTGPEMVAGQFPQVIAHLLSDEVPLP